MKTPMHARPLHTMNDGESRVVVLKIEKSFGGWIVTATNAGKSHTSNLRLRLRRAIGGALSLAGVHD